MSAYKLDIVYMSKETIIILPNNKEYKIRKDRYRKARGGTSKVLDIFCSECSNRIMVYQKDGPGNLLRCYFDRIGWPPELSVLKQTESVNNIPNLVCSRCNSVIGTPMIYSSENRSAFRMRKGSFQRKVYTPK